MDDKRAFLADGENDTAHSGNLALLRDIAQSFRRVRGDESFDDKGERTIWHQARLRTEMLTWEDTEGKVVRQELSFFGLVVEHRMGKPLCTGKLPVDDKQTGGGRPMSTMVERDAMPAQRTLDYASHLLKSVPQRDYYTQHLLKQVNHSLSGLGFDESRTVISSLDSYSKEQSDDRGETTQRLARRKLTSKSKLLALAFLALAGLLLGLGAGLLLWE